MKRFQGLMALAAVCGLLTACGGSSSSGSSTSSKTTAASGGKVAGKLVVDNESGSTWTCQFNPFNAAVTLVSFGWVYEPLEYVNILKSGSTTPWLATSSQWSNAFKTLTFTIRSGAKWSDGQPFTADDVAYTFNAMKTDKAIDLNALWKADGGPLTDVALKGNQVVFTFSGPSQP
jgi:peptide/nickel transport system substrate-binding protein